MMFDIFYKQRGIQRIKASTPLCPKAYWEIGERIVQQEQNGTGRAKYGDYIIRNLSKELSGEFGTGFSIANLKNCRQFYRTFPKDSIGYTVVANYRGLI